MKLVLPSYSDSSAIFHLGRSYYTELLHAGVMIHERRGAVMHAKTACIDGVWSTIGSTNLDWRSFLHNDELNAVILGRGFATQMDDMFAADLLESDAMRLDHWKRRSWLLPLERTCRTDSGVLAIARLGAAVHLSTPETGTGAQGAHVAIVASSLGLLEGTTSMIMLDAWRASAPVSG